LPGLEAGWLHLAGRNFGSEGVGLPLQDVGYGFGPDVFILTVVFAVRAVAVRAAVLSAGKALAVQLQALRVLAGTALLLPTGLLLGPSKSLRPNLELLVRRRYCLWSA